MASKSLTLKFGADTSKLSKALKRMRQRITGAVSGAFSAATSLRGLAVAVITTEESRRLPVRTLPTLFCSSKSPSPSLSQFSQRTSRRT